jgi:hypothetical protein
MITEAEVKVRRLFLRCPACGGSSPLVGFRAVDGSHVACPCCGAWLRFEVELVRVPAGAVVRHPLFDGPRGVFMGSD